MITQERQVPGSLVEPVLHLPAVAEADAGEYFCAASNAEGSTTSEPIVIDVTCRLFWVATINYVCGGPYKLPFLISILPIIASLA